MALLQRLNDSHNWAMYKEGKNFSKLKHPQTSKALFVVVQVINWKLILGLNNRQC